MLKEDIDSAIRRVAGSLVQETSYLPLICLLSTKKIINQRYAYSAEALDQVIFPQLRREIDISSNQFDLEIAGPAYQAALVKLATTRSDWDIVILKTIPRENTFSSMSEVEEYISQGIWVYRFTFIS